MQKRQTIRLADHRIIAGPGSPYTLQLNGKAGHFLRGASHALIKGILEALNLTYLVAGLIIPDNRCKS
jgi:hypothetical protein